MSYDPNSSYGQAPPPYGQPIYGQTPHAGPPVYRQPQHPQKPSLRWLWITLAIIGGLLVLSCAACGMFSYFGYNFLAQVVGPQLTVRQYYQAIELQDYAMAYSYLTSDASVTINGQGIPRAQEAAFETAAKIIDSSTGTVSRYNTTTSGSDTSYVTVTVIRRGQPYDVHLVLVKANNTWKIQSADGI